MTLASSFNSRVRCGVVAAAVGIMGAEVTADDAIRYVVSLEKAPTQTLEVDLEIPRVVAPWVEVALPVWRPGKYEVLDFAGSVRRVAGSSVDGIDLSVEKTDKTTWRIETASHEAVRMRFELDARSLRDRTRHVDDSHAFISGSAVFPYVKGRQNEPVIVHVKPYRDWKVTTGLSRVDGDPNTFVARDYQELIDCPLEIGTHELLSFEVDGVPHDVAIWGRPYQAADDLTDDLGKLVQANRDFWGRIPYERYVFIIHMGGSGGGTEHLNSTVMQVSRGAFERPKPYRDFLSLASHEYFHTWNVKALRPAGLTPYDLNEENYSKLLWVAEGTTSYYGDLLLVRSSLLPPDTYFKWLSKMIDRHRRRPGRQVQSLEASSFDAWIKFNRRDTDSVNSTVSFYTKGALVSWMLDFELRRRTENRSSLDDVLRKMFETYPLSAGGYTASQLQRCVEIVGGSSFEEFFADYVHGTHELGLETVAESAGLRLSVKPTDDPDDTERESDTSDEGGRESKSIAYLGLNLVDRRGRAIVGAVLSDGPAYTAGVLAGDEILALDGFRLSADEIDVRVKAFDPGEEVELTLFRRDKLRTIRVTLGSCQAGRWTLERVESPTLEQEAMYESWLGQPWKKGDVKHPG